MIPTYYGNKIVTQNDVKSDTFLNCKNLDNFQIIVKDLYNGKNKCKI